MTFTVRVTYIAALPDESLTFKGHGIAADHIHVYGCRIDYDIIRHIDIVGGGRTGIAIGCSENNVHWIAAHGPAGKATGEVGTPQAHSRQASPQG